jgi:hypothetical protein
MAGKVPRKQKNIKNRRNEPKDLWQTKELSVSRAKNEPNFAQKRHVFAQKNTVLSEK